MNAKPVPYSDNVESIPVDEESDIQRVVSAVKTLLSRGTADSGRFRADVHVKTHGYANGQLTVLENLPAELSQGLFEKVKTFPVVVRFSNSANKVLPDAIPDGRGMAIKVRGVDGEMIANDDQTESCQDFVMINHPVFFAANPRAMLRLEQFLVDAEKHPIAAASEALTGGDWNPLNWHWRELSKAAQIVAKIPTHPASNTYFSMSPFRYGDYVAKFRVTPAIANKDSYLTMIKRLATESDFMRLVLEETLARSQSNFIYKFNFERRAKTCRLKTPQWNGRKAIHPIERWLNWSCRNRRLARYESKSSIPIYPLMFGEHLPPIDHSAASIVCDDTFIQCRPPGAGKVAFETCTFLDSVVSRRYFSVAGHSSCSVNSVFCKMSVIFLQNPKIEFKLALSQDSAAPEGKACWIGIKFAFSDTNRPGNHHETDHCLLVPDHGFTVYHGDQFRCRHR